MKIEYNIEFNINPTAEGVHILGVGGGASVATDILLRKNFRLISLLHASLILVEEAIIYWELGRRRIGISFFLRGQRRWETGRHCDD